MFRLAMTCLRVMLAAWIGAAVLYVITSVAEQTSEHLDSRTRDQLAAIRFPLYYRFGFGIHFACLASSVAAVLMADPQVRRRLIVISALILLSLLGVCLDYFYVFRPLLDLITPPGRARTPDFVKLHNMSRYANQAHLMIMMMAAVSSAWPIRRTGSQHTA